ncbi:DHA2 family efflux MFS transporter permease subunit [Amycolatopsis cihanbeyliensis]|uniref:EmrB/QacA subfamily drug resistance transporter n=1 Tax=Amycolatopsis cihanbeyliensis TaxID=1128664 RepID=A0A542DQY7_AMYCI|nr:DHA2 family efflux MFS transporter permease subunit [Amycolatopsis cihanbeyliensis]TQJ05521.1 EmrB/QacA subfamily drug resistance transporter [Amycolatopsis cihanbeyliensis]
MATPEQKQDAGQGTDKLDKGVLKVAVVVILGAIMAILDTTVVNVALQALTIEFETSFDTVQWIVTGYMLALATVIPVTGWACDRFGTKRLYLLAIALFLIGSMLAGLAWSIESLILFRVVQGLGGGMLMPAGMTIMTKAAGPHRVGRVMAVLGVPMLLGPIGGPILGGWLVDSVSWRWIFYINVPIGIIALLLAWRLLPKDDPEPAERFDFVGMVTLSPGLAALIYGVSNIPSAGGVQATSVWLPTLAGIVLIVGFVLRALRIENALIDLRLFRDGTFSVSVVTMALFSVAFFGAMLLLPTYFLLVRGETALQAGLLLAPQGIGAMITMPLCGRLADKIGAGKVVLPGLVLILAGMGMFTQVGSDTPYWQLLLALFVMGLGMGATMMPIMSAALQTLTSKMVARASSALNIIQQTAGAVGSAVMSIILAGLLAGKFGVPTSDGQLAATAAIANPATREQASVMAADSFASTFVWAVVLIAVCLVPALFLPKRPPEPPVEDGPGQGSDQPASPVLTH